jgi:hypothetical protein
MTAESVPDLSSVAPQRRRRFSLPLVIVTAMIAAAMVAAFVPAIQAMREASRRTQCHDHLRAIVIALQHYHDRYKITRRPMWPTPMDVASTVGAC